MTNSIPKMRRIYLDHAATSPLVPQAREAMLPWLDSGNASSLYAEGRRAKAAIDEARETLAEALGCLFAEVVFTSGGTEAANLAIVGVALNNQDARRSKILMSAVEHHCVLNTRPMLEALGYEVALLPVDCKARLDVDALKESLDETVLLASVMHANNEIGTINPIEEIAEAVHAIGALFHSDAVQTFGRRLSWSDDPIPKLSHLPIDLLSFSAHKIGGPKGAGGLFVRAGVKLKPLIAGGGQEREVRGGTENVAAIAGFGAAVRAAIDRPFPGGENPRDVFLRALLAAGFVATAFGHEEPDSPKSKILMAHAHVRLPGVGAETMLIRLDREGIAAGSGAACSSGSIEPSHVLQACGYSHAESKEGLRFTFGPATTVEDAAEAAGRVVNAAHQVREARA